MIEKLRHGVWRQFRIIALLLILAFQQVAEAQSPEGEDTRQPRVVLRTNLLYDATLSPNLGIELRTDSAWSVGANVGVNFWDIDKEKNKKWRHVMVSPYVRYYLSRRDSCSRHPFLSAKPSKVSRFVGIHAVYSHYNASNVKLPLGLYPEVKDHRLQGDLVALGGSFGWNWRLGDRWHVEAEAGAALGYT